MELAATRTSLDRVLASELEYFDVYYRLACHFHANDDQPVARSNDTGKSRTKEL